MPPAPHMEAEEVRPALPKALQIYHLRCPPHRDAECHALRRIQTIFYSFLQKAVPSSALSLLPSYPLISDLSKVRHVIKY